MSKHLFWRTVEQLEAQRRSINNFLSENQFQALAPRSLVSTAMLSSEQLEALEADGLITPVEAKIANSEASQSGQLVAPEQGDNEDYDAARAVFDAVSGKLQSSFLNCFCRGSWWSIYGTALIDRLVACPHALFLLSSPKKLAFQL